VNGWTPGRRSRVWDGIVLGLIVAAIVGTTALYLLHRAGLAAVENGAVNALLRWLEGNLDWSVPAFALLGVAFVVTLLMLCRRLRLGAPIDQVAQADQLSDLWINLFFGVGVIFTAIGMRGALLFALGDPDEIHQAGAFAVLERMVEGGILLALSTTIVGGVGGYLMQVAKALVAGSSLKRFYIASARHQGEQIERSLCSIEERLDERARLRANGEAMAMHAPPGARAS
jgi:hypothetical protein